MQPVNQSGDPRYAPFYNGADLTQVIIAQHIDRDTHNPQAMRKPLQQQKGPKPPTAKGVP